MSIKDIFLAITNVRNVSDLDNGSLLHYTVVPVGLQE